MQLGFPNSLWWLLLGIPIVVLYLWKVERRRVIVPTLFFWDQVFDDSKPRAMWHRVRNILSLFLQLLFLVFLTFALADPLFSWQQQRARTIVLIVDNSASMSATDLTPSRLQAAMRIASNEIRGLRDQESMAIVSAAFATVEVGLNRHPRILANALKRIPTTDAPARMEQALALASRLIDGKPNGRIVVLTDQRAKTDVPSAQLRWIVCGSPADNVAITQFQVRRTLNDRIGFQVLIKVANFSDTEAKTRLELNLAGQLLDVVPLDLAPNEVFESVLDYASAEGGTLEATLDQGDALASDNQAVAELAPRLPQKILLVSSESLFVESALRSIPQVDLSILDVVPSEIPADTILVVHRMEVTNVPSGHVFVINPIAGSDLWSVSDTAREAIVAKQDAQSPLTRHVRLQNVTFPGARPIETPLDHQIVIESVDEIPLLLGIDQPATRVLILNTDLESGDLPLRTAFPILMSNAIEWFRRGPGEFQPAIPTGEMSRVEFASVGSWAGLERDVERFELTDPHGRRRPVFASSDQLVVGPFDQVGVWRLQKSLRDGRAAEQIVRRFACNLVNPEESDIRIEPRDDPAAVDMPYSRPLWTYLIWLSLLLTGFEWLAYQRRWIE